MMKTLTLCLIGLITCSGSALHAQDLAGIWQGTMQAGPQNLRTVFTITSENGALKAVMRSLDQGGQPIPVTTVTAQGAAVRISVEAVSGTYDGKMTADGKSISGTWSQGPRALPLVLTRATPDTAWALPAPPTPMAANAPLTFEVATIKPSQPGVPGKVFTVRGREVVTMNTSLSDLLSFAYDVHAKQVVGGASWLDAERFDVTGRPDAPGVPNVQQLKQLMQSLLADRFKLAFHREKRELAVYALTVAKAGPKIAKSQGDPNGLPGLMFRGLGNLPVINATMADFASVMQGAVLDRPVIDQTGLTGKFDFTLSWTPDETQFGGLGVRVPTPTNEPGQPPGLFTAIQEQLGLRLDAAKLPAEVLVIDHVEKPSDN